MTDDFMAMVEEVFGIPRFDPDEHDARLRAVAALLARYGVSDDARLDMLMVDTADIPFGWLLIGMKRVLDSRVYSTPPQAAELRLAARDAAGMHREQYHAGRYLQPPREWPPAGQRHAVTAGEFEALPDRFDLPRVCAPRVLAVGPGSASDKGDEPDPAAEVFD